MHKKCSGVGSKLKEDGKFKYQACTNQQTNMAKNCRAIESNCQSLETGNVCYVGDTVGAWGMQVTVL